MGWRSGYSARRSRTSCPTTSGNARRTRCPMRPDSTSASGSTDLCSHGPTDPSGTTWPSPCAATSPRCWSETASISTAPWPHRTCGGTTAPPSMPATWPARSSGTSLPRRGGSAGRGPEPRLAEDRSGVPLGDVLDPPVRGGVHQRLQVPVVPPPDDGAVAELVDRDERERDLLAGMPMPRLRVLGHHRVILDHHQAQVVLIAGDPLETEAQSGHDELGPSGHVLCRRGDVGVLAVRREEGRDTVPVALVQRPPERSDPRSVVLGGHGVSSRVARVAPMRTGGCPGWRPGRPGHDRTSCRDAGSPPPVVRTRPHGRGFPTLRYRRACSVVGVAPVTGGSPE